MAAGQSSITKSSEAWIVIVVCGGHLLFLFALGLPTLLAAGRLGLAVLIPSIAIGNRRSGTLCYSLAATLALLPNLVNWLRTFPKSVCGAYILRVVPMSEWPR